jgi:hypothetical protein
MGGYTLIQLNSPQFSFVLGIYGWMVRPAMARKIAHPPSLSYGAKRETEFLVLNRFPEFRLAPCHPLPFCPFTSGFVLTRSRKGSRIFGCLILGQRGGVENQAQRVFQQRRARGIRGLLRLVCDTAALR